MQERLNSSVEWRGNRSGFCIEFERSRGGVDTEKSF